MTLSRPTHLPVHNVIIKHTTTTTMSCPVQASQKPAGFYITTKFDDVIITFCDYDITNLIMMPQPAGFWLA